MYIMYVYENIHLIAFPVFTARGIFVHVPPVACERASSVQHVTRLLTRIDLLTRASDSAAGGK